MFHLLRTNSQPQVRYFERTSHIASRSSISRELFHGIRSYSFGGLFESARVVHFVRKRGTLSHPEQRRASSSGGNTSVANFPSLEGWHDSHAGSVGKYSEGGGIGARAAFRKIPVHKPILSYIETIGLGMRPGVKRNRKKRRDSKRNRGNFDDDILLLSDAEEKELFVDRGKFNKVRNEVRAHTRRPDLSGRGKTRDHGDINENGEKKQKSSPFLWLPPPPFASNFVGALDDERTAFGHKVIRLPVKVLGSAGSLNEEMPRSSKGLPEVALAGRSNVGKSTLLNALLYGNQPDVFGNPIERQYTRGKTPDRIKLPKGKKAVVSDKPGETREITLYQLSSKIIFPREDGSGEDKSKMSLVLADLPGYGFAYASEEKASMWRDLMQHYLLERGESLKRVLLLIDARHGLKAADFQFLETLQVTLQENEKMQNYGKKHKRRWDLPPIQIVLTKCDLCMQDDLARRVVQVRQQLSGSLRREPSSLPVMLVSAKAGLGYNNIRRARARGGVLELQRELAALVSYPSKENESK